MSTIRPIRVAYADPPYPGCASLYSKPGTPEFHPRAGEWDDISAHVALVERLESEYPDGWAFSTTVDAMRVLFASAPPKARLCAWVKPFISSLHVPTVGPVRSWEPVLVRVGSDRHKSRPKRPRDWVSASTGPGHSEPFIGAKPVGFSLWLFDVMALGQHMDDELVDMFPGSGAVSRAWDDYRGKATSMAGVTQGALFGEAP